MIGDTERHSASFERTWWRAAAVLWVAGLVAVLLVLFLAAARVSV